MVYPAGAMYSYLEFEVSLRLIKPRIWRRFQITANASFFDLHDAIQDSFRWGRCHLWEFHTPGRDREVIAGIPPEERTWGDEDDAPAARLVRLTRYFRNARTKCVYWYDFGDDWQHTVELRERVSSGDRFKRRLLAGRRRAPLEDCGGVSGYYQLVESLETGNGDDELATWRGSWKPDDFSLAAARRGFDR